MLERLSAKEKEARLKLFRSECKFIAGAATKTALPQTQLPEIAFIGKSNVGKSSLINALLNRKALARVSHTPGRTKQINFFDLAGKLLLVDLPGYGYAKVSHKEQKQWEKLILHYLDESKNLKLVGVLIDSRRAIKEHDRMILDLLTQYDIAFQVILTKSDKISKQELQSVLEESARIVDSYRCNKGSIIATSSRGNNGTETLRLNLGQYRI